MAVFEPGATAPDSSPEDGYAPPTVSVGQQFGLWRLDLDERHAVRGASGGQEIEIAAALVIKRLAAEIGALLDHDHWVREQVRQHERCRASVSRQNASEAFPAFAAHSACAFLRAESPISAVTAGNRLGSSPASAPRASPDTDSHCTSFPSTAAASTG